VRSDGFQLSAPEIDSESPIAKVNHEWMKKLDDIIEQYSGEIPKRRNTRLLAAEQGGTSSLSDSVRSFKKHLYTPATATLSPYENSPWNTIKGLLKNQLSPLVIVEINTENSSEWDSPVELLIDSSSGRCLCEKYPIQRMGMNHKLSSAPNIRSALIICASEVPGKPQLPEAVTEAENINEILVETLGVNEVTLLTGDDADITNVTEKWLSADLIHFTGHSDSAPPRIFLNDGEECFIGNLPRPVNDKKPLVFVNGCWSGANSRSGNFLSNLINSNQARAVIGMRWPVSDQGGRIFAESFYQYYTGPDNLGLADAVLKARNEVQTYWAKSSGYQHVLQTLDHLAPILYSEYGGPASFSHSPKEVSEMERAENMFYSGRSDQAMGIYRTALRKAELDSDTALGIAANRGLARYYEMLGEYDKTAEYLHQASLLSEKSDDPLNQAHALRSLSDLKKKIGDNAAAVDCATQAYEAYLLADDLPSAARALTIIGDVHRRTSNYDDAVKVYLKALEIEEEHGDSDGQCIVLTHLARCHSNILEHDVAKTYLERAQSLVETVVDVSKRDYLLLTIASTKEKAGRSSESEEIAEAGEIAEGILRRARESGNIQGRMASLWLLSRTRSGLGDANGSLECLKELLEIGMELTDSFTIGRVRLYLGDWHISNGEGLEGIRAAIDHWEMGVPQLVTSAAQRDTRFYANSYVGRLINASNSARNSEDFQLAHDALSTMLNLEKHLDDETLIRTHRYISDYCMRLNDFDAAKKYNKRGLELAEDTENWEQIDYFTKRQYQINKGLDSGDAED